MARRLAWTLLLLAAPAGAVVGPWHENPHSKVRLVTPYDAAPRQGLFLFALEFELQPGWHAYWRNSGDAGFPPVFDAAATPELREVRTLWPAPRRFELPGDLDSIGYAESVTYPLDATIAAPDASTAFALRIRADYLVCEVECVPYRYDLEVEQPLAAPGADGVVDAVVARAIEAWRERVPTPIAAAPGQPTWITVGRDGDGAFLRIHLADTGSAPPDVFFDSHPVFTIARPVGLRARLTPRDATAALPATTEISWVVGAWDARQTVELTPSPQRGAPERSAPRWPIVTGAVVLLLALVVIVLGRKLS